MSFFGAVFASLTLFWERQVSGAALILPFVVFALIAFAAGFVIRRPGEGLKPSPSEGRAIMWSSVGEGIGLFLASNILINLHRPDLLLPSMALVVGLHFLPIARAADFRPFYVLGSALIVAALIGLLAGAPNGGELAGFMAACALWLASIMAILRDRAAKDGAVLTVSRSNGSEMLNYSTRTSFRADLNRIGLRAGDTVMVHAAMSRVGPMLNGPDALSMAMLDVLGLEGTMLVYTSWDSVHEDLLDDAGGVVAEWRQHVPAFDPRTSRAVRMNGIIAEFVRTMPGAQRSENPGASVAAIGKRAEWITADHPQDYGYGEGSPFAKLVDVNGRVLMVGAPWDTMTLIHHADHLAALPDKRRRRYEVPFADGTETSWRVIEEFDTTEPVVAGLPENYIEQIVSAYAATGAGRCGQIGLAPSLLVDAKPMLAFAIDWLEARVTTA